MSCPRFNMTSGATYSNGIGQRLKNEKQRLIIVYIPGVPQNVQVFRPD